MNIKVVYHSRTGNTKKIAEAIAESVSASVETISENIKVDAIDILFLGDGVYAGKIDSTTETLLKN